MTTDIKAECAKREELHKILRHAPKPQLHIHLDGSLSYDFIMRAAKRLRNRKEGHIVFEENWEPSSEEELVKWFVDMTNNSVSDNFKAEECGNWRTFDICNQFLQTKEDLVDAAHDIVLRIVKEHNVNYIEIRFAPILHTTEGLTEKEVIYAVSEGLDKGVVHFKDAGKEVHGGLILCALRSFPVTDAIKTVKLISELNHDNVLAFDIAGDEGSYCLKPFEEALRLAKEMKIKITTHAGEWNEKLNDCIHENLELAVDIGVDRIGHGVALRSYEKDHDIFTKMESKGISVEVNLTSNCTDPKIVPTFSEHPLQKFLECNVKVAGLSVDNWLLAGNHEIGRAEPTGEFVRAIMDCGISTEQLLKIVETGYLSAFKELPETFIDDAMEVWRNDISLKLEVWKST